MRQKPCPTCGKPITFSWADFVFLNNWGKASLFCLGCGRSCTISNAASQISFVLSVGGAALLYILLFNSGLLLLPEYAKAIFVVVSVPAVMLTRAIATERFAELAVE
mgnify:CR=1 FL=1